MNALWILLLSTGCGPNKDTASDTASCSDLDGAGTDTGNLPGVLGRWTVTFGSNNFTDGCGLADFDNTSENWLNGAMEIRGRVPDALYAVFDEDDSLFDGQDWVPTPGDLVTASLEAGPFEQVTVESGGIHVVDLDLAVIIE